MVEEKVVSRVDQWDWPEVAQTVVMMDGGLVALKAALLVASSVAQMGNEMVEILVGHSAAKMASEMVAARAGMMGLGMVEKMVALWAVELVVRGVESWVEQMAVDLVAPMASSSAASTAAW